MPGDTAILREERAREVSSVQSQASLPSYPHLHDLMTRYRLENLVSVSAESFTERIHGFLTVGDHAIKGCEDPCKQIHKAVDFQWGHHHDFGAFGVPGRMCKHHMSILSVFIDEIGALSHCLDGLRVLDIGPWTGGTSLLLCAMGAEVVAVEEVKQYSDCLDYMRHAFGIRTLECRNLSLFDCTTPDFQDAFDVVLLAGVLHHLSDPKLALRILFNCLQNGGKCLIETLATDPRQLAKAHAPSASSQDGAQLDVPWNAMLFTPENLAAMMTGVGYEVVQPCRAIRYKTPHCRLFAVGQRTTHVDLRRNGLSVRSIR